MTEDARGLAGWKDLFGEGRLPRFALICLGVWLNAADSLVTATIMPSVGAEIGGHAYFSWAVAGFLIGAIAAGASAGRMSEIVGLRPATIAAGLLLGIGCVMSATAPGIALFLIGRVIQGIGSGWVSGLAMVAIALLFPERQLGRVFAAVAAVWGIATVLGPLIGGLSAEAGDWRLIFWIFAGQAVLFAGAARLLLPASDRPDRSSSVPWRQLGLLCLAVGAITIADVSGSAGLAIALIGLALLLLTLLLRVDRGAPTRLLPRAAGDFGTVCGLGYAAMFFLMAAAMGFEVYGSALLQALHGLTPLTAGYVVAAPAMAWTLAAFAAAGASGRAGDRWIRIGALCVLAGPLLLAPLMRDAPVPAIIAAALVMGAGFGFSSAQMNQRVLATLPDADRAVGSSALIAVRQTGEAIGAALAGATANLAGFGAGLTLASARATALWIFIVAIPLGVIGVIAARRMTRHAAPAP